jgi:hypothetical protein
LGAYKSTIKIKNKYTKIKYKKSKKMSHVHPHIYVGSHIFGGKGTIYLGCVKG